MSDNEPNRLKRDKGHMLCGERVSEVEFDEYMRTGVPPSRILKGHNQPKEKEPWD